MVFEREWELINEVYTICTATQKHTVLFLNEKCLRLHTYIRVLIKCIINLVYETATKGKRKGGKDEHKPLSKIEI